MRASLLVARICTGARLRQPEQQRRQLDQPAAADHRVHEPGRERRQPEQDQHGQGRLVHAGHPRLVLVRIVSLLPSTTEILFALGAGDDVVGVTFECDTPAEAREPHDRVDLGDARRGSRRPRSTRTSSARWRGARTSTTSRPTRCARLDPDPGRHPGPLRGLRGRRDHGRRRARPPRLQGRGADRRPAHPRRGPRLGAAPRQGHRPRRHGAATLVDSLRERLDAVRAQRRWPAAAAGRACSSGPTRRTPRATGSPRWSSSPAARTCSASRVEKSVRVTLGRRRSRPPGRGGRGAVRLRPRGGQAQADVLGDRAARRAWSSPSTPTACGPVPARGWSTASRSWRQVLAGRSFPVE